MRLGARLRPLIPLLALACLGPAGVAWAAPARAAATGSAGGTGSAGRTGSAGGTGSAGAPGAPGSDAVLSGFACRRALDPVDRAISVTAVMRPVPGTAAMAIRVRLLARVGARAPVDVVRAGDLGVWISPEQPGLGQRPGDVWRLQKTVVDLPAPAGYRFELEYRWSGPGGHVIAQARRFTRSCRQLELRPDLLVRSIATAAIPGDPAHDRYTAVVADRGLTGAGPFDVELEPGDGSPPITTTIARLGAGRSRVLQFLGPVCQTPTAPTVTVDPLQQVDDLNRANNTRTATCPAPEPPNGAG